jgi:hypothetical protein
LVAAPAGTGQREPADYWTEMVGVEMANRGGRQGKLPLFDLLHDESSNHFLG